MSVDEFEEVVRTGAWFDVRYKSGRVRRLFSEDPPARQDEWRVNASWELWNVDVTFRLREGAWVPIELRLRQGAREGEPRALSTQELRRFAFGGFVRQMLQDELADVRFRAKLEDYSEDVRKELAARAAVAQRSLKPRGGSGRKPLSVQELQDVATVYSEALARGLAPTATVAARLHLSHSAAAKRVARARVAGLLAATSRGRAAGLEGAEQRHTSSAKVRKERKHGPRSA